MTRINPDPGSSQEKRPSLLRRISLAFGVLVDADLAARVDDLQRKPAQAPAAAAEVPKSTTSPLKETRPDAALQLLALLQRDARLIDFTQEDVSGYSDADVGAAARLVHEGCRKVLREHFTIQPVRAEAEGSRIVVDAGFDAAAIRLVGNVVGAPPFRGSLSHRGWRAAEVRLPKLLDSHDAAVLAQAEVEL